MPVRYMLRQEALGVIENARQIIGSLGHRDYKIEKALALFSEAESRALDLYDDEHLNELAQEHFEKSGSQSGFALMARRLLLKAEKSNRGKDYNKTENLLRDLSKKISEAGHELDRQILQVRVDLNVRWWFHKVPCLLYWEGFLEDLEKLMELETRSGGVVEPLNKFYFATGLAQTGMIEDANRMFASLRQDRIQAYFPNKIRTFLINREGIPSSFQGELHTVGNRHYFTVPSLSTDIPVLTKPSSLRSGRTENCYIGLSMNGFTAYFDRPYDRDSLKITPSNR